MIESGLALAEEDGGAATVLDAAGGQQRGQRAGARSSGAYRGSKAAALLRRWIWPGENVIAGVDVDAPLALPPEACLEVFPAEAAAARTSASCGATVCTTPSSTRCSQAASSADGRWRLAGRRRRPAGEVWPGVDEPAQRSLWNARASGVREASDSRGGCGCTRPNRPVPPRRKPPPGRSLQRSRGGFAHRQQAFHGRRGNRSVGPIGLHRSTGPRLPIGRAPKWPYLRKGFGEGYGSACGESITAIMEHGHPNEGHRPGSRRFRRDRLEGPQESRGHQR